MGKSLSDQVIALDKDLGAVFTTVLNQSNGRPIDAKGMLALFQQVLKDNTITSDEAEALLLVLDNASFTKDAQRIGKGLLGSSVVWVAASKGAGRAFDDNYGLPDFYHAMGLTSNIWFWSPGTKLV